MSVPARLSAVETLRAARRVFEKPRSWTQRVYARDQRDDEVSWADPQACKFCMFGAMYRGVLKKRGDILVDACDLDTVLAALAATSKDNLQFQANDSVRVLNANDALGMTQDKAVAWIDRAIAHLEPAA